MSTLNDAIGLTEADIIAKVVSPDSADLPPDAARAIVGLRFDEEATLRMRESLDKNNKGTISPQETEEMEKYRRVGMFLDLLQAKARLSLKAVSQ